MLEALGDRPILFFGGKGGVGKTTLASVTALRLASAGHRTLLVSTDPAHSTSDILQCELGSKPRPVVAGCEAMEIDPEREADAYIESVKARIADVTPPRLVGEVDRQIDIARVSPGAVEAALFDRFTRILEEEGAAYDRIVFDTAPTGQTLRLLSLPELMTAWMSGLITRRKKVGAFAKMWRNVAGSQRAEVGSQRAEAGSQGHVPGSGREARDAEDPILAALEERRGRFHRARKVLTDPARTAFAFVLIAERLPIWETETAVAALTKHGIPVGAVIVNQLLPTADSGAEEAPFLRSRRAREAEYLARIRQTLGNWPLLSVRLQDADPVGVDALERVRVEVLE